MSDVPPSASAIAGALSSCASLALTYPLLTISTRQQVRDEGSNGSLFAGLYPSLVGTFASQGVFFYYYQLFSTLAARAGVDRASALNSLVITSAAGAVNAVLTNPVWVVATRMQTDARGERGASVVRATVETWRDKRGLRTFLNGVAPSLLLVANPAIMMAVFEPLVARIRAMLKLGKGQSVPAKYIFVVGALAKLVATLLTFPILTVKARLQAQRGSQQSASAPTTVLGVVNQIVEEGGGGAQGVAHLYKGLNAKLSQTVLNSALMFVLKDAVTPLALRVTSAVAR